MTDLAERAAAPTVYAPSTKAEQLSDALGRIITGRPLPDALCPPAAAIRAPATVEEGIGRIVGGPARA